MNKEVFVSPSWSIALQHAGWILCLSRLRGMKLFSCNCQVSSKNQILNKEREIFLLGEVAPYLSSGKCSTLLCTFINIWKMLKTQTVLK